MNLEKEIFKRTMVNFKKVLNYGFVKKDHLYLYSKTFMENFRADIQIDESGIVSGKIYDVSIEEEYNNFRIERAGTFASKVRCEYQKILEDIVMHCFEKQYFITNQANRITTYIKAKYHDEPEFAWEKSPGFGIFRNPNNEKWYGLIMNIDKSRIDKNSSGEVEVMNVKLDPQKISKLLRKKGFYPSYHMNKKNWITILLDETLSDEEVITCIEESHAFTEEVKEWIIPANPKYYDVITYFDHTDIITWKQSSNIKVGDMIYLYVASPYSAILYKCEAIEVDIPYHYKDQNLSMKHVMKLKLAKKYDQGKYSFMKLKEYGINAIRGPRSMPKKLSEKMNCEDNN